MDNDGKNVEIITKSSLEDQAFQNRYYARLGHCMQFEVFKRHRKVLYMLNQKYKNENVAIHILSYSAFVLAIKSIRVDEQKISTKNFVDLELEEIQALSILKIMKYKDKKQKKVTKRSMIIAISSDISTALDEGLSFRDLEHYLKKEHNISAKKSTIFAVCKEMGIKNKGKK